MSVKIHYSFIVYILILFFFNVLQYYLMFFLAIFIHEATHGIVGRICGIKTKSITISFSGLSLHFENFEKNNIIKTIVLLSGPISNLIIAYLIYLFFGEEQIFFVLCNLILAIFNLIPIYPLDGGKILLEIIGIENENKLRLVQNFFCIILGLLCMYMYINFESLQLVFVGIYLMGFSNFKKYDKYFLK